MYFYSALCCAFLMHLLVQYEARSLDNFGIQWKEPNRIEDDVKVMPNREE